MAMRRPRHPLSNPKGHIPTSWQPITRVRLPDGTSGELVAEYTNGRLDVRRSDGSIVSVRR
jgi:hypothetical protein